MAVLLHIDTAGTLGSIAVSRENEVLIEKQNSNQMDHATWIHTAVEDALQTIGITLSALDACSVTIGPGSYTGLRVGLSTAKGYCYALQKPLITIPTLQLMASVIHADSSAWICPMIDARRMEVFYALYNDNLQELQPAQALVLDAHSFAGELVTRKIIYCGDGADKFKTCCSSSNASFSPAKATAAAMVPLALKKFSAKDFADVAYATPLYGKEFYTLPKS